MSMVIRRTAWHYRLHAFVRRMWGWTPSPTERWSLCPYFHTTFWGTGLTVIAAIPAILGWLICRLLRKLYKVGSNGFVLRWFANLCDRGSLGSRLDDAPNFFAQKPILAGLSWLFLTVVTLLVTSVLLLVVGGVCYFGIDFFPKIPHALKVAGLYFGWGGCEFFGFIGMILSVAGHGIASSVIWLVQNIGHGISAAFWAVVHFFGNGEMWSSVFWYVSRGAIGIISLALIGLFGFWFWNIPFVKTFRIWIELKANGYADARNARLKAQRLREEEEAKRRAEEEAKRQEALRKAVNDGTYKAPKRKISARQGVEDFFETIFDGIAWFIKSLLVVFVVAFELLFVIGSWLKSLYSRDIVRNGEWTEELGPIGVFFKGLWAIKSGVCPVLEFADDADLSNSIMPKAVPVEPKTDSQKPKEG